MWISIFSVTLAVAIGSCIVAIMMRPKPVHVLGDHALVRQSYECAPSPAIQSPQLSAQEYVEGENGPRPVSSSLPDLLRQHYGHVLIEPIPVHLEALMRDIGNLATPLRDT
jgi:hypothetical protein